MKNILANMAYIEKLGIYPHTIELEQVQGTRGRVGNTWIDLFCVNDYLGLSERPDVWAAASDSYSHFGFGARATRMAGGTFSVIQQLERELGELVGKENSVTFASGCQANFAVVPAICNLLQMDSNRSFIEPTTVFIDQFAHASLFDAVRVAGVPSKVFPHDNVSILAKSLDRCSTRRKIIIVDGLYSVEASLAPLPELMKLAEHHDALVYMDDAHGIGPLGNHQGGTGDHFEVSNHPNLIVAGTLSKTFGGVGGFVAGSTVFCKLMRVAAHASIFSHSLPPAMVCGFLKGLSILRESGSHLQQQMLDNIRYLRRGLIDIGLNIMGQDDVPIIPILVGDEKLSIQVGDQLLKEKLLVPVFRYPAVPKGKARMRIAVTATHTRDQLDHAIQGFKVVQTMVQAPYEVA